MKSLRTAFFAEHITVCYTFSKFYVMIEFLDVFGYKINIFHISCTIALISSIDHGYFVLVFTPKFLVSVTFACITTSAPELFWLNRWSSEITSELQWVLPVTYCENCEYELLKYYTLLLFLFRSGLARHGLKWPTKKQIDAEVQGH